MDLRPGSGLGVTKICYKLLNMGKKIKILSVGHSYVVSLNRAILREIAEDPDFSVTVGAPSEFKGSLRTIPMEPEPVHSRLNLRPIDAFLTSKMHFFFYNPLQLRKLFSENYDCAHFWEEPYIHSGYQLAKTAAARKIPYLFRTAQSLVKNYAFPFSHFEKQSVAHAQTWVAGGHLVFEAMNSKGWGKTGQVLTLAVDTNSFKPLAENQKQALRIQKNLQYPVIGYLGRLSEEKGCDLFMNVLGQLKHLPWSFLVMGSGPYDEKIRAWARREGLADRVQVQLFKHDEVPQVLPVCDLLICPSQTRSFWKEQFGRMIVEAFAAGVPVMGSDSGEIPRVIGDAGIVLPESDPASWKSSLEAFLKNPQTLEPLIAKGLQRSQIYSAKSIAESYKSLYRSMAK